MTDSLKWVVTGVSFALLVGAFFAGQHYSRSGKPVNIVSSASPSSYPAPEVSIVAQATGSSRQGDQMLAGASGLYSEGLSTSRRKRASSRKSKRPTPKRETASPLDADPEMGFMSADDAKLREAMEKADRAEQTGDTGTPLGSDASGH